MAGPQDDGSQDCSAEVYQPPASFTRTEWTDKMGQGRVLLQASENVQELEEVTETYPGGTESRAYDAARTLARPQIYLQVGLTSVVRHGNE